MLSLVFIVLARNTWTSTKTRTDNRGPHPSSHITEHHTRSLEAASGRRSLAVWRGLGFTPLVTDQDASVRFDAGSKEVVGGVGTAIRFYLLAFTISWVVWGSAILWSSLEDWEPLIIIAGAYGPLLAAVVLPKLTGGTAYPFRRVASLRGRMRWVLIGGLFLPLVIAVAHVALYRVGVDAVTLSSDPPWYLPSPQRRSTSGFCSGWVAPSRSSAGRVSLCPH